MLSGPLSLWGGTDSKTGMIVDVHHPQHGTLLAGRVMAMDGPRGRKRRRRASRTGPRRSRQEGVMKLPYIDAAALAASCPR